MEGTKIKLLVGSLAPHPYSAQSNATPLIEITIFSFGDRSLPPLSSIV